MKTLALLLIVALTTPALAQDAGTDGGIACLTDKFGRCLSPTVITDGGTRLTEIYEVCPEAPLVTAMPDGGFHMTPQRRNRINCLLTGCESYARQLEQLEQRRVTEREVTSDTSTKTIIVTSGITFAVGLALGFLAYEKVKPLLTPKP